LLACVGLLVARAAVAGASLEYRVKAVFLYNFAKFIEWPPDAFAAPGAPFGLCVLGNDPFGPDLEQLVGSKVVQGRPLAIRRLADLKAMSGCHILFVAAADGRKLPAILQTVGSAPILTVGEDPDFTQLGGAMRFFLLENRVRFEINVAATARAHLKLSAKLLDLARVVGKEKG
jgi:hypothetical protein